MPQSQQPNAKVDQQKTVEAPPDEPVAVIKEYLTTLLRTLIHIPELEDTRSQIRDTLTTLDEAADAILSEVEKIQTLDMKTKDGVDQLRSSCSAIIEACSFHDLCSQRLSKVDAGFNKLTEGIGAISAFLGESTAPKTLSAADGGHNKPEAVGPEAGLLNGPALAGEGVDQDDIDRILDFD